MAESEWRETRSASPSRLVQIPECLHGDGIECFTTPHLPGFQAAIKTIAEDFVVTEIDSNGQLVQLDTLTPPLLPSPPNHTHQVSSHTLSSLPSITVPTTDEVPPTDELIITEEQCAAAPSSSSLEGWQSGHDQSEETPLNELITDDQSATAPAPVSLPSSSEGRQTIRSRPDINDVPPLNELITEVQYKALSEMAEKVKMTLDTQLGKSVCLGEIPDREKRGFVHNAVRLAFPVLKTKVTRSETGVPQIHVLSDPNYIPLCRLLGEEDAERLLLFVSSPHSLKNLSLQPDSSREHRQQVHRKLSELYGRVVSSRTHSYQHWSSRKRRKVEDGSAESAEAEEPPPPRIVVQFRGSSPDKMKKEVKNEVYTKFVLRKTNLESLAAIQKLSEVLNCQPSHFSTCGIKDKRAVTTQVATIKGVTPQMLHSVAKDPALSGITMGNYELTDHHVAIGQHSGNHFKIILRNVRTGHVISKGVTPINHQSIEDIAEPYHMTSNDDTVLDNQRTEGISEHGHMTSTSTIEEISHMTSHEIASTIETTSHMTSSDVTIEAAGHMTSDDVTATVPRAIEEIREAGFINYFGPQRFGSITTGSVPISSLVALAMLKNDFKAAVDLSISTVQDSNSEPLKEAKRYFTATHDTAGTLEKMPRRYSREGIIMRGLHRHGYTSYGCQSALMSIPHSWRTLYVQSFTSLVFNHLVTYRVREYGLRPVKGDLVLKQVDDPSRLLTPRDRVHMLTQQEINSGQYSLRDVVLPLLGTSTVLPGNRVGDKLKEILSVVGITLASFRITGLRMHLPGSYRRLIAYPKQLSWRWVPPNELARLGRRDIIGTGATTSSSTAASVNQSVAMGERDGGKDTAAAAAVELSFSLENSCYATVFLREVMKQ